MADETMRRERRWTSGVEAYSIPSETGLLIPSDYVN
jgi:hypothetical protein